MGDETVLTNLNGVTLAVRAEPDLIGRLDAFLWILESVLFGRGVNGGYPNVHMNWTEAQLGIRYNTNLAERTAC